MILNNNWLLTSLSLHFMALKRPLLIIYLGLNLVGQKRYLEVASQHSEGKKFWKRFVPNPAKTSITTQFLPYHHNLTFGDANLVIVATTMSTICHPHRKEVQKNMFRTSCCLDINMRKTMVFSQKKRKPIQWQPFLVVRATSTGSVALHCKWMNGLASLLISSTR